jgi:hypothetical protein
MGPGRPRMRTLRDHPFGACASWLLRLRASRAFGHCPGASAQQSRGWCVLIPVWPVRSITTGVQGDPPTQRNPERKRYGSPWAPVVTSGRPDGKEGTPGLFPHSWWPAVRRGHALSCTPKPPPKQETHPQFAPGPEARVQHKGPGAAPDAAHRPFASREPSPDGSRTRPPGDLAPTLPPEGAELY